MVRRPEGKDRRARGVGRILPFERGGRHGIHASRLIWLNLRGPGKLQHPNGPGQPYLLEPICSCPPIGEAGEATGLPILPFLPNCSPQCSRKNRFWVGRKLFAWPSNGRSAQLI